MAQATQEVQNLYSELINQMKQGVQMHEQLADYYGFLNLPGYQKCHEYQMLCELLTYRKAKDMYMREYNQLVPLYGMNNGLSNMANNSSNSMSANNYTAVIPTNWYTRTRYEVDAGTKRTAVRDGFKRWIDYEKDTKQFLINMEQRLQQANEPEAARKLDHLIEHVDKEIETAEEKLMNLESTNYDMSYILQQQDELKQKYAKKIRELNQKDSLFRRRGEGNYANYNFNDDEDEDEDREYYYMRGGRRNYYR